MSQHYANDDNESGAFALPSLETFYCTTAAIRADDWRDDDGELMGEGWYWWACFPGCMPDSDPSGPYATEAEALADARDGEGDDE
jgi:hypothetical protein